MIKVDFYKYISKKFQIFELKILIFFIKYLDEKRHEVELKMFIQKTKSQNLKVMSLKTICF